MTGNTVALETIAVEKLRRSSPKNELIKKSTHELSKREKRIERNNTLSEQIWYENGLIMLSIRDENLHKEKYGTFESYLEERWQISRIRGHHLMKAAEFMRTALKIASEKPALEGVFEAENVNQNSFLVNISQADLPRNERQVRPLIEQLCHNGERLKVWSDVVATGEKPTQRLVEAKIAEFKASGVTVPDFDYEPVEGLDAAASTGSFHISQGNNDWYTPAEYIEAAREVMGGIDLDPASSDTAQEAIKATAYFTAKTNGLDKPWNGRIWLNPPFSMPLIEQFVEKLLEEWVAGRVSQATVVTNNATDTGWFHALLAQSKLACLTKGRVKFYSSSSEIMTPRQGQVFFYFGNQSEKFSTKFAKFGAVVRL